MCANPQDNWLNTIAVRASYILPFYEAISSVKTKKNRGVVYLPPEKSKTKPVCLFEFCGRPFRLTKFHWNEWDVNYPVCWLLAEWNNYSEKCWPAMWQIKEVWETLTVFHVGWVFRDSQLEGKTWKTPGCILTKISLGPYKFPGIKEH